MLSCSIRRVVILASPPPPASSSSTNNLPRIVASACPFTPRFHQRRASSSKPPSPANGSKGAVETQPTDIEEKPLHNKRKTKSISGKNALKARNTFLNVPSVPSTQYITPSLLGPASFFSLHRPISITNGFPQPVTEEAFASIFTAKGRNSKSQDVVSTLSNTLEALDAATGRLEAMNLESQRNNQWNRIEEIKSGINENSSTSDGNPTLSLQKQFMSEKYAPFNAPPAPIPIDATQSTDAVAVPAESQESQHRIYTAVLTVEESTDYNGDVTYMAHHSPLVIEDSFAVPNRFTEPEEAPQGRDTKEQEARNEIHAISVKRQRKLKMKKHKYKKLMRRTRNLRRRQDRN
ncbi:hypothetical protein K3495_g11021 [Podosphaera aphanis]|nr:hypothetical protein K3495_g11021 [Podosphaera aphanis]